MSNASIPTRFTYSQWRHGGWYVNEVRYPSGAIGCVSRNYPDGKWRIVCGNHDVTFPTREAAARAELEIAAAKCAEIDAAKAPPAAPVASVVGAPARNTARYCDGLAREFTVRFPGAGINGDRWAPAIVPLGGRYVALADGGVEWVADAPTMVPQVAQQQQANAGTLRTFIVTMSDPASGRMFTVNAKTETELCARRAARAARPGCIVERVTDCGPQAPAMVPQPSQPQQAHAAPSGFYAFQAAGERAERPRAMGPQERDGITPKTIQAQTVQVRTRAEWYAFHHACRHLARQRMIGGRGGETFIPANICGRMHRLDVSRLSISYRKEGDRVRPVTNGSHIALKASMISARPRRALIAFELEWAATYRRNAARDVLHSHRRAMAIKAVRACIAEARTLATNFNRLPE